MTKNSFELNEIVLNDASQAKASSPFQSLCNCVLTSVHFFYFGVLLIYFGYALIDRQFCYHVE